jgi:hypothetical protein
LNGSQKLNLGEGSALLDFHNHLFRGVTMVLNQSKRASTRSPCCQRNVSHIFSPCPTSALRCWNAGRGPGVSGPCRRPMGSALPNDSGLRRRRAAISRIRDSSRCHPYISSFSRRGSGLWFGWSCYARSGAVDCFGGTPARRIRLRPRF